MQLKPNLKLRKIGPMYMVVDVCSKEVDTTQVYTLNDTAAWLWEQAAKGEFTIESLTDLLCQEYDVAPEVARQDVEELLLEWKELIAFNGERPTHRSPLTAHPLTAKA